jgi:hypothetical protein
LLGFSGFLLFSQVVLTPVLLAGITTGVLRTTKISTDNNLAGFAGFLDNENTIWDDNLVYGGASDIAMTTAALAAMRGQSAPAASTCTEPTCKVTAQAASLFANCTTEERDNPDGVGIFISINDEELSQEFCSSYNPSLCVTLTKGSPYDASRFATSYTPDCGDNNQCIGAWISLFGAFTDARFTNINNAIKLVDCRVNYGTITITQRGVEAPRLDRSSFKLSDSR